MGVGRTDLEVARVASDRFDLMVPESPLILPRMPQMSAPTCKEIW